MVIKNEMIYGFYFLFMFLFNNTKFKHELIKEQIVNYIKADFLKQNYSNSDSLDFFIGNTEIEFNSTSVLEGVISKKYIKGFSAGNYETTKDQKILIKKVYDSLRQESNYLSNKCKPDFQPFSANLYNNNSMIIFLSAECNDMIYAEAIHKASILVRENKNEFYGKAFSYLFKISGDTIAAVYKGEIAYN